MSRGEVAGGCRILREPPVNVRTSSPVILFEEMITESSLLTETVGDTINAQ